MALKLKTHLVSSTILATLAFVAIVVWAPASQAQASGAWTLAPTVGFTSFSIKGSNISGSRSGGQLGALVTYQLDAVQLESGLLYTQAGAKNDAILASSEYALDYLHMPLGVRYFFATPGQSWYARGGVALAYLLSAESKTQIFGLEQKTDIKNQMNTFDVLPYLGVGYGWALGDGQSVDLDLNYMMGLTDVFKNGDSKSRGWNLALRYSLAF